MSDMQWQPIETAPKDGIRVLLWDRLVGVISGIFGQNGQWLSAWNHEVIPLQEQITHWMPEPEGPKGNKQ